MADTWEALPENPQGVPEDTVRFGVDAGDPRGEYPLPAYHGNSSINKEATGAKGTDVKIGGGHPAMTGQNKPAQSTVSPQYGSIQVKETKSGHVQVFDDTPGGERVVLKHTSGAGVQMASDGSMVIRAKNNGVISIDANGAIVVEGDLTISAKNMKMDVTGDLDLDVKGDYNVKVGGNQTTSVEGNFKETSKAKNTIVKGVNTSTVLGQNVNTILGASITAIKGNSSLSVSGSITNSAKGVHKTSSQAEIIGSSPRMSLLAADMSVLGAGGTIGGENMIMYAYNMHATKSVHADTMAATTFHGDLNGTAKEAIDANKAATAAIGAASTGGYTTTNTATDNTATAVPNANMMKAALKNSSRGVKKVLVDPSDSIKNGIDKSSTMGGVADRTLDPREARAKLKEPKNFANADFISALLKDESIGSQYSNPSPPAVGRTSSGAGSVARSGSGSPNFTSGTRTYTKFTADPKYNPKFIDPRGQGAKAINAKTLVGNGIPISTFLAGPGGATNLGHLSKFETRASLMRQLVLQSECIKICKDDDDIFEDFRLVVAEGVYKPASGETLTEGSIPFLRQTGRAVVYELYDEDGNVTIENSFDFAELLADQLFGYDSIELHYDKVDPTSDDVHTQIVVVMPEVDEDFNIPGEQPEFKVKTLFNNNSVSGTDLIEVDESGIGVQKDGAPPAGETAEGGRIEYQLAGKKRDKYVSSKLENALAAAAKIAGVDVVMITSGGQPGSRGTRTGSLRHDTLDAADLICKVSNRQLNKDNMNDRRILDKFVRAARTKGILAGGMSSGYMGAFTMHLDMLGASLGGGNYNRSSVVTWRSDQWFINAMNGI